MTSFLTCSQAVIDAKFFGNEARFVNDHRGTGQPPNVRLDEYVKCGHLEAAAHSASLPVIMSAAAGPGPAAAAATGMHTATAACGSGELVVGLFCTRAVAAGEELLTSYGDFYPLQ